MNTLLFLADAADDTAGGIIMLLVMLFALGVGIFLWILPGIIANIRKHPNRGAIWALTLLAGWSCIGWVAAFVWAFTNPAQPQAITINNNPQLKS
jgi:hypothetical protein